MDVIQEQIWIHADRTCAGVFEFDLRMPSTECLLADWESIKTQQNRCSVIISCCAVGTIASNAHSNWLKDIYTLCFMDTHDSGLCGTWDNKSVAETVKSSCTLCYCSVFASVLHKGTPINFDFVYVFLRKICTSLLGCGCDTILTGNMILIWIHFEIFPTWLPVFSCTQS